MTQYAQMKNIPPSVDPGITVPISLRLPANLAILITQYAEEMNTSAAKLVASLLEDTLPAFTTGGKHDVKIRISQVYQAMVNADLLQSVNKQEIKERVLRRTEAGGPMGRPPKKGGN